MMDVINFFFNDFLHFVMLLMVCLALSPKINITQNSSPIIENKKDS